MRIVVCLECKKKKEGVQKGWSPFFFAEKSELRQVQTFLFALKFVS